MPASLPKASLRDLAPTVQEIEAARKIIQASSDKELKSKMTSFGAWLKQQEGETGDIAASRGDQRKEWLALFLTHQSRAKQTQKVTSITKDVARKKEDFTDVFWWSMETMDKEMGPLKGSSWRSCGRLKKLACPLTGSNDDHLVIYAVPQHWKRMTHEDLITMRLQATSDTVATDFANMDELAAAGSGDGDFLPLASGAEGSAGGLPRATIKQESFTPAELEEAERKVFLGSLKEKVMQINSYEVECKEVLKRQAELTHDQQKYSAPLADDIEKHSRLLLKLNGLLKKCITETPRKESLAQLMKTFSSLVSSHASLKEMASKFELVEKSKKRKRVV